MLTAIAAAIGILSLIFAATSDPAVEGFLPRVAFAAIPTGLVLFSKLSSHVQEYFNQYWRGFLYLLVIWMAVLTFLNSFSHQYAGGLLYVVTVACAAFNVGLKTKRHVLLFSIFIVGLGACILFTAPGSGVSRTLLASALVGVAFVSYPISIWRLQTHNRLASSEQRFSTLAHAAFEGLLIIQDDTIIDHNERAVQLFGPTDPPTLKGRSLRDLLLTRDQVNPDTFTMAPGEQWVVELRRNMDDSFPAEVRTHELPYDNDSVVVLAIRDVTLQAEYERHLLQTRKKAQETQPA